MARAKRRKARKVPKNLRLINKKSPKRSARNMSRRSQYGAIFFAVLAVTVASTVGFFGIVASVLAGS